MLLTIPRCVFFKSCSEGIERLPTVFAETVQALFGNAEVHEVFKSLHGFQILQFRSTP